MYKLVKGGKCLHLAPEHFITVVLLFTIKIISQTMVDMMPVKYQLGGVAGAPNLSNLFPGDMGVT